MAPRKLPPQAFIRQCFSYDRHTGVLRWKTRPREHFKTSKGWRGFNTQFAGKIAGAINHGGYASVRISIVGAFLVHRLIWCGMTGEDPGAGIDHINGRTDDNRWTNLRLATHAQNHANQKVFGRVGLKGVRARSGKFAAQITSCGKVRHLGTFSTAEEAHEAYCRAAQMTHGEFWSDGKRI